MVNSNQGFLTLLALVLAAAGVWATLITSETMRYRAAVREAEHGRDTVRAALQELHHNLIHVALAFDTMPRFAGSRWVFRWTQPERSAIPFATETSIGGWLRPLIR